MPDPNLFYGFIAGFIWCGLGLLTCLMASDMSRMYNDVVKKSRWLALVMVALLPISIMVIAVQMCRAVWNHRGPWL